MRTIIALAVSVFFYSTALAGGVNVTTGETYTSTAGGGLINHQTGEMYHGSGPTKFGFNGDILTPAGGGNYQTVAPRIQTISSPGHYNSNDTESWNLESEEIISHVPEASNPDLQSPSEQVINVRSKKKKKNRRGLIDVSKSLRRERSKLSRGIHGPLLQ